MQIQKRTHSKESAEIAASLVTSAVSVSNQRVEVETATVDAAAVVVVRMVVKETVEATKLVTIVE